MKTQRLAVALTVINVVLLMFVLAQFRAPTAEGVAPVLRGRALEIVDGQGRVRASIKILTPDPNVRMPNGEASTETVILRLIDSKGKPSTKIATSEQGAGLSLVGEEPAYVVLKAEGTTSSLKLSNKDGRQQVIEP